MIDGKQVAHLKQNTGKSLYCHMRVNSVLGSFIIYLFVGAAQCRSALLKVYGPFERGLKSNHFYKFKVMAVLEFKYSFFPYAVLQ